MSKKHKLMQDTLVNLPFWSYAKKEQAIKVPQNKLRTCSTRVIDVATKFNVPTGPASVSLECQHSSTHLLREENRIQDHNLAGLPVFMFVSSDAIRDVGNGRAMVRYWVRDWARRHGRQQFASIDDNGDIWWCWLDTTRPWPMRSPIPLERVRLDLGSLSPVDSRWKLGVGVDASTPDQSTGKPSLLIAAPCWESTLSAESRMRSWPPKATTTRKAWQPKYFPQTKFMGYPGAAALFGPGAIVHGGF